MCCVLYSCKICNIICHCIIDIHVHVRKHTSIIIAQLAGQLDVNCKDSPGILPHRLRLASCMGAPEGGDDAFCVERLRRLRKGRPGGLLNLEAVGAPVT